MATQDTQNRPYAIDGMLAMTGPSVSVEPGHLPVRGDLAHIRLAGRYFVPHYAVPMPHSARAGAVLRAAGHADGETICTLDEGATFEVLDIAGAWAWGQLGADGPVGYVALGELEVISA
ncbi:SH3 domain-containing protein [Novosphingobium sp. 9]|uniref:SH3 domain-containing protein n=1 Tax=Novosphingobium sp. 9 TaxID=2025349 RepID=UPI0028CBB5AF|nr:SH3 domain-containing protein [Novosphingobium sp. 9]